MRRARELKRVGWQLLWAKEVYLALWGRSLGAVAGLEVVSGLNMCQTSAKEAPEDGLKHFLFVLFALIVHMSKKFAGIKEKEYFSIYDCLPFR